MKYPVRKTMTVFALLASTWPLQAQTTAPAAAKPAKDEETVVLSPFEVTATKDTGYQATETLAGTRIRTDLRDVGSAISVVTKEFMKDIGATDNSTLLQYTTNAEVAGTRGTYAGLGNATSLDETGSLRAPSGAQRVRGLASADNTRDYFVTDIPTDYYNVDRVDIQRGPNSILFGLGSPAGIVNASLHSAEFIKNKGSVEFRTGSYGSVRSSIDVNQILIPKVLAIRVDGLWNDEKYEQKQAWQDSKRIYGALRFDPQLFKDASYHTSIKVKFENGDVKANRPRTVTPNDSITPWFRPAAVAATPGATPVWTLNNGMGKREVTNGYEVGAASQTISPWLGGLVNQQQPLWFMDGMSNQLYRIYGGYVNTGALSATTGLPQGASNGIAGQRYADVFTTLTNLPSYANNAGLPGAAYGQYRTASLQDPTVFDFYHNLLDGPTAKQFEKWNAINIDISQTAFDDRLGVQLSYDRQQYKRGGQNLITNPTINIDILKNFQDYVVGPTNASNANVANPNFGRPYVAGGPGGGNSYDSDRKYVRGSVFGEIRASDYLDRNGFLSKVLGKHRFNGVYSDEKYSTENRRWQMYANSAAYSNYKLQGNFDGIANLAPVAVLYLGSSLANATSASGAYISPVSADVKLPDGNIYQFDMTWRNPTGVLYTDTWNVPTNLQNSAPTGSPVIPIFNGNPVINTTTGLPFTQLNQASNPANYVGWNSNFHDTLLRYNDGADQSLVTAASKSYRQTKSYAGSWQGFLWDNAIVPTLGWRYDEVKSRGVSAVPLTGASARGALNYSQYLVADSTGKPLNPFPYALPTGVPDARITNQTYSLYKDHSTAGGVVVHINKLFGDKDPLPFNVSLSYNKSSNFQVTDARRDIYGNSIANPSGSTKDYGVLLSTKDGKYSFRAIKYETTLKGANTQLDNSGIYGTLRDTFNWRNIKTYYMSAYAWSTAGQTNVNHFQGQRHMWDPSWVDSNGRPVAGGSVASGPAGSTLETQAQADVHRDAALKAINNFQIFLAGTNYFNAWNYSPGPTTQSALQTRGEYETAPKLPDPASVYDYRTSPVMQGFAVTADTQSKGYEFELTANPLPNWRVAFNASQTIAIRTNVGGAVLDDLVARMDALYAGPAGDLVRFNSEWSAGNALRSSWNGWRGQYTLMKLQEGTAASELRKWRYNIVSNYSFKNGMLKGVGLGASYRWQDKVVIGYPVIAGAGGLGSFDLTKPYYGPSEDAIDVWASYERKLTDKIYWKIQLNVRNLGKNDGLIPISVQPDGQTWAGVRVSPVQEWFVTNTFSF